MLRGNDRQRTRAPRKLTPELVAAANKGSEDCLWDIYIALRNNSSDCTVDVVKLMLKYLDPTPLTRFKTEPWYSRANRPHSNRAMYALYMLSEIPQALYDNPPLKNLVLDDIIQSINDICLWIDHSFDRPDLMLGKPIDQEDEFGRYTTVFGLLQDLDPRISRTYKSSPAFCNLLIRIAGCPIINLFKLCVEDEDGRELLLQELSARPNFAKDFASSTLDRVKQVRDADRRDSDASVAIQYVHSLLGVIRLSGCDSPPLQRAFVSAHYLKQFTTTLVPIARGISPSDVASTTYLAMAARELGVLAVNFPEYLSSRNHAQLVASGYMDILARLTGILPPEKLNEFNKNPTTHTRDLIEMLGGYSIEPRVLAAFIDSKVPLDYLSRKCKSVALRPECVQFSEALRHRVEVYSAMPKEGIYVCDNQSCKRRLRTPPLKSKSKECSGCSSVTYCSRECQVNDWKELHRVECSMFRVGYFCQKACHKRYPHSTRAYHVAYVESLYNRHLREIELKTPRDPRYSRHDFIAVIDITSPHFNVDFSLTALPEGNDGTLDRFERLFEGYRTRPDVRLVQVNFLMSWGAIPMLVLLEPVGGVYEAVYNLVRWV
ncbi:hypothetical protein D9611_012180 [Ephemerocybe angulata]|uniref:MYND-type domain-containing protein n=1 Tax=Ephemerocybe angulata TaxID=980116 RepID=A0A8H5FFS6_9AGAR|nr:hypothetical protein D9611_012180 [Tulosesus angulatus]